MNSRSPSWRLVSRPARSEAFSTTGPEVTRIGRPISSARIIASVVLPRPGGPWRRMWSSVRPSRRAAPIITRRRSTVRCWPTKSSSFGGRSAASSERFARDAASLPASGWGSSGESLRAIERKVRGRDELATLSPRRSLSAGRRRGGVRRRHPGSAGVPRSVRSRGRGGRGVGPTSRPWRSARRESRRRRRGDRRP